jgi:chromosome segregation ATPase
MTASQAACRTARLGLVLLLLSGCQQAYYNTMEAFGYHKRDLLTRRVEEARDTQQEAKEQFRSALEQFSTVVKFHGGELEEQYTRLKKELDQSEAQADAVRKRINAVESVAEALFDEWETELSTYTNARLRRASAQRLAQTRQRYTPLIRSMRRAEAKIEPVLAAFRDQVLFLKHNLNARAIASLQDELDSVEADIAVLVQELEAAIAQADTFIQAIGQD